MARFSRREVAGYFSTQSQLTPTCLESIGTSDTQFLSSPDLICQAAYSTEDDERNIHVLLW